MRGPIFLRRPSRVHSRRFRRDIGFTLTELVIAMLVLGVLASIAVPSFLGSRNNSYDKEAQASIQAILRAANLVYQSQGDFSDGSSAGCGTDAGSATSLAADLQRLEPGVDVVGGLFRRLIRGSSVLTLVRLSTQMARNLVVRGFMRWRFLLLVVVGQQE